MPPTDYAAVLMPAGAAMLCSLVLLYLLARMFSPRARTARHLLREAESSVVLLFEDETLVDATPRARALLRDRPGHATGRETLIQSLGERFPGLRAGLDEAGRGGRLRIDGQDDAWLDLEYADGLVRVILRAEEGTTAADRLALAAAEDELEILRSIARDAPVLVWKEDSSSVITWANRAYLDLVARLTPSAAGQPDPWPPHRVFPELEPPLAEGRRVSRRLSVRFPTALEDDWFEITSLRQGDGAVHFAVDANAAVRAESAQQNFVQTLTKTFAQLSVGLAIFDRQRRLVMFNPALLDLTGLPVAFLSTRPLVRSFLDRLRENRMLPEPRNYRNWREELLALEAEAADGSYCENWSLPGGQTYRVTGRPHPEGAIAFLFEDISAEISLTRQFRAQIDMGQSVIDALPEAIAAFALDGTLLMTNAAYDRLWREEAPEGETVAEGVELSDIRLSDETKHWQTRCAPTSVWAELADFCADDGEREAWTAQARLSDGRDLHCRVVPLPGGAAMVAFTTGPVPDRLHGIETRPDTDEVMARRA